MPNTYAAQAVENVFDSVEKACCIIGFFAFGTLAAVALNLAAGATGGALLHKAGWKLNNGDYTANLTAISEDTAAGTAVVMSAILLLVTCIASCVFKKADPVVKAGSIALAADAAIGIGATAVGAALLNRDQAEMAYASAAVAMGMGVFAAAAGLFAASCYIGFKACADQEDNHHRPAVQSAC